MNFIIKGEIRKKKILKHYFWPNFMFSWIMTMKFEIWLFYSLIGYLPCNEIPSKIIQSIVRGDFDWGEKRETGGQVHITI
jgi:hypothetical protein